MTYPKYQRVNGFYPHPPKQNLFITLTLILMGGGAIIFAKMYCIKIHIKLCCITLKMVCKLLFMYQNKVKVSNGPKKNLFGVSGGLKIFGPLKNLINKCSYSHGGGRNYLHQPIPIYKIKNKGYRIQDSGYRIQDT